MYDSTSLGKSVLLEVKRLEAIIISYDVRAHSVLLTPAVTFKVKVDAVVPFCFATSMIFTPRYTSISMVVSMERPPPHAEG
jgi:hypothetical protein